MLERGDSEMGGIQVRVYSESEPVESCGTAPPEDMFMGATLHCKVRAMGGNKKQLSDSIRDRVRRGLLPRDYTSPSEVDLGDGRACGCCDKVLTRYEVRYDVVHRVRQGKRILIPMHGTCLDSWRDVVNALARQCNDSSRSTLL